MNYDELNRVLKYGADDVANMLNQLASPEHNQTRWGGEQADHTFRGVLADALDETGRSKEAGLLRNPNQHVLIHEGSVRPGRFNWRIVAHRLNTLADEASGVYGSPPEDQFYGLYHDAHPTDPSKHNVWLTHNPAFGPPDEIPLSQLGKVFADDAEPDLLRHRDGHHPRVELALERLRNSPYEEIDSGHPTEQ